MVIFLLIVFIWSGTILCGSCNNNSIKNSGIIYPNGKRFAGNETCKGCHKNIFELQSQTPHELSSRPGNTTSIKGSFEDGKNVFKLSSQLKVVMEKTAKGLSEVGYVDGLEVMRQPMDIVIGSGTKGQTYLYWYGNKLFQLPVSYYTPLNTWCKSPGFPNDKILFNRPISGRCLECHSTYAKSISTENDIVEYDKARLIYGIGCERCHGPAADHVAYHFSHTNETKAKYIINPARLSRQQKLDNCALCHSGLRESSMPSFSFITGDKLDDYSTPDYKADTMALLDVHGNQYGLLTASKCFKMSTMDCSSCHNTHVKETNDLQLFSQRCMNCHTESNHNFCKQKPVEGLILNNNCIDCHMPELPSKKIFLEVTDKSKSTPDLVRTHFISIYKEQTKLYIQKIKEENSIIKR